MMCGCLHVFFHLCLVSVLFSGSSLTEMKLQKNFSQFFVLFQGFSKPPSKQKTNTFIVLETNTFVAGMNVFCTSDERFSARYEDIALKTCIQTSVPHTAKYQRLSSKTYFEMIATHRYSLLKMGGSYHILILPSEYTTPTSYMHNRVLCWTKRPSSRLS